MAQALLISLFAVLCFISISEDVVCVEFNDRHGQFVPLTTYLINEVLSEDCAPYVDSNMKLVQHQSCSVFSCGGTCTNRYCIPLGQLDQSQFMCLLNNLYVILGVSITFGVLLIAGICASCWKCCFIGLLASNRAI